MDRTMVADLEVRTSIGLTFIKNRELEGSKTTYRSIELINDGTLDLDNPFLPVLFNQYEGSILKVYNSYEDWKDSLNSNYQVLLIPDLQGDKFFQDRWERVIRFVEKHV